MESHNSYYPQQMYTRDANSYGVISATIPGGTYPNNQPPACIYQRNSHDGAYGGQAMAVVEQCLQNTDSPPTLNHQMSPPSGMQASVPGGHAAVANPTPAHVQNSHLMNTNSIQPVSLSQPPPAHSQTVAQSPSSVSSGQGVGNAQNSNGNSNAQGPLQFAWMKTTKSHAHQWKAQWPESFDEQQYVLNTYDSIECNIHPTIAGRIQCSSFGGEIIYQGC